MILPLFGLWCIIFTCFLYDFQCPYNLLYFIIKGISYPFFLYPFYPVEFTFFFVTDAYVFSICRYRMTENLRPIHDVDDKFQFL